MKDSDKKFLLDSVGWEVFSRDESITNNFIPDKDIYLNDWNPDRDYEQFSELWFKLSPDQRKEVLSLCTPNDYDWEWMTGYFAINMILEKNGLTMLINAIIETLKN